MPPALSRDPEEHWAEYADGDGNQEIQAIRTVGPRSVMRLRAPVKAAARRLWRWLVERYHTFASGSRNQKR